LPCGARRERRGQARRRALLPRLGMGMVGRPLGAEAPQRATHVQVRRAGDAQLQVVERAMSDKTFKMTLHVWRQSGKAAGAFKAYTVADVNEHMSFLEMLDVLNERLIEEGDDPVAFDHDCREGICGMCG